MAQILDQLSIIITNIIQTLGYPGITFVMFAENIFPPIPSELVMPFAGFLVAQGGMDFLLVMLAGTIGAVLGTLVLYYLGAWLDEPVIRSFIRRYGRYFMISEDDLDRALHFFERYGSPIVFFGRLIPIIRSLISIPAGMNRMPLPTFLLFTVLGTTVWNLLLTGGGWVLGENWELVIEIVDTYQNVVYVILAVAVVAFVVFRLKQRRDRKRAAAMLPDTPEIAE